MGKRDKNDKALDLRGRAEEALRKRKPVEREKLSTEETHRLIHELEVYQIELEMQNEELKLSQEQIEESRSKYTDLFDFAPVAYFTLDQYGLILEVNLTGADQLRLERSYLMKTPFSRLIHRDDQDKFYMHCNQVMKTKIRQTCDIRLKSKDSTEFYAQLVSTAVKDLDGNYIQTRTAVTDITDRVKAEEMIKLSEENYARLLESISDGIAVLDRNWRYVLINNALLHMTGKSREELLGQRIMDVFPGVGESQFFKAYKRVIKTGKPEVITDSFTFEDGRKGWFEVHAYPVPEGIFIIASDVTDRWKAEETLKARERQQAAVAAFGQHALATKDLPALMDEAINLVAQTLNVDYAKILELLPEGNALLLKFGAGWKKGLVGREILEAGTGSQCGYTLLTNKPVIVDDLNRETRFSGTKLLLDHGITSGISIVIQGEIGPYGTLSAHTTQKRQFTDDDINFMLSIANILAVTIKRISAEERLRESELFALATIDALSANIAVIDETGKIISVNKAWKDFADTNPPVPDNYGVGANYLQICDSTEGDGTEEASTFAGAIRSVIRGEIDEFTLEYPCHSPHERRWFIGRVTRFHGKMSPYVVLAHENITEQKQAEEKITSLSKFPSENPNPVLRIGADGIVLYKNEAVERLLKAEGLNRKDIYRILPDNVQKLIQNSLKTKKALYDLEVIISDRTYSYNITPVSENNYANLYATDITERKQAEDNLKDSEERFGVTFNQAAVGIAQVGINGQWLRVNQKLCEIVGYKYDEMLKLTFQEITHPDDLEADLDYLSQLLDDKIQTYTMEKRYIKKDGSIIWINLTVSLVRDTANNPKYFISIIEDITEQKRAEEKITSLSKFPSENPNPVLRTGANGIVLYKNEAVVRLLKAEGLNRNDIYRILPNNVQQLIQKSLKTKKALYDLEVKISDRTYSYSITPVSENNYANLYAIDITERKQAEEKLKQVAEELARSNMDLERFAYIASHDLKEPLRTVSSFVTLLQQRYGDQLDKDAGEFIGFIVDGTNRMGQLIDDLLAYSQVSASKKLMSVDFNKILVRSISNLTVLIEENRAKVTFDSLPTLMADDMQLELLFQNLINNGIKFHGEEPPHIHISARQKNREWVFSIKDNGIGIGTRDRERIFNIFQRLHSRSQHPGTGIGLAICRKIVDLHSGKIWVESEPGRGSIFYFTIPVMRE